MHLLVAVLYKNTHSYPCQPTYTVYIRTLIYVHSVLYLPSCCAVKQKRKKKSYTQQTHCFFLNFTKLVKLIRHVSGAGIQLLTGVVSTQAGNGRTRAFILIITFKIKQTKKSVFPLFFPARTDSRTTTTIPHTSSGRTWKRLLCAHATLMPKSKVNRCSTRNTHEAFGVPQPW